VGVNTVWMRTLRVSGPWTTPSNVTFSDDTGDSWFKMKKPSLNVAAGFPPLSPKRRSEMVLRLYAIRRRRKRFPMALSSRTSAVATSSTHQNSIFFFAVAFSFFAESFSVAATSTSMKMWPCVAGARCALTSAVIWSMGFKTRHPSFLRRIEAISRYILLVPTTFRMYLDSASVNADGAPEPFLSSSISSMSLKAAVRFASRSRSASASSLEQPAWTKFATLRTCRH